jgi:hypothetical protein
MDQSELDNVTESSDSAVAVDEQPAATSEVAAEVSTEAAAPAPEAAPEAPANGRPDPTRGFLAELAQAMKGAAERERERISGEVDASAEAHVEKVRARAATEAAELRRLAEQDIDGIHAWSREETIRIQQETERRIGTRREELQGYLVRHATIIDGEVGHIEGAVREYRTQLDRFFEQLAAESDPAGLARLADQMPEPPDLGKVGGAARAEAVAALAEEQDAADQGVADAVASVAVNAQGDMATAFDPAHSGPELVPVMAESNGSTNAPSVMASVVASGDAPAADVAPTGSVEGETASEGASEHPNVAMRLFRTIASSLSAPTDHPAEAVPEGAAEAATPESTATPGEPAASSEPAAPESTATPGEPAAPTDQPKD